jgi:hypothetical protein
VAIKSWRKRLEQRPAGQGAPLLGEPPLRELAAQQSTEMVA